VKLHFEEWRSIKKEVIELTYFFIKVCLDLTKYTKLRDLDDGVKCE